MSRMHSRKKGKSGSTKPPRKVKPTWVRYTPKEVTQLTLKLAGAGKTASEIGIILRDSYGIPSVKTITKKKVNQILEENKLNPKLPEDLIALIKKDIRLLEHAEINKKDMTVKRGLQLTESKINRLAKYYRKTGKVPATWKYKRKDARLLIS